MWIDVDGYEDLPEGHWLVRIEREMWGVDVFTAIIRKNLSMIGTNFAFDMPKVIAYAPVPTGGEV